MLSNEVFAKGIARVMAMHPKHSIWNQKVGGEIIIHGLLYDLMQNWPDWLFEKVVITFLSGGGDRESFREGDNLFAILNNIRQKNELKWKRELLYLTQTEVRDDDLRLTKSYQDKPLTIEKDVIKKLEIGGNSGK